MNIRTR